MNLWISRSRSRRSERLAAEEASRLLKKGKGWSGMRVDGMLALKEHVFLPPDLEVEALDLSHCSSMDELPEGLRCFELNLSGTKIRGLPYDLEVESILNLSGCDELTELPTDLTAGTLILRACTSLAALPERLDVWFLDMTGCWNFRRWPKQATIRSGQLNLRGCTALTALPEYLGPIAALDVRGCPSLRDLPQGLRITGWIDLAQSGL